MSLRRWLICTLLLVSSALAQSSSPKLKMVVILTRHGVRAPIKHIDKGGKDRTSDFIGPQKGPFAEKPWPELKDWDVDCDGFLTPTGITLATRMGVYYRDYYINKQKLLPNNCPSQQQVYIWADNEQRTFQTASALAEGLFPRCSVKVNRLDYKEPAPPDCKSTNPHDYFFHPLDNDTLKSRVNREKLNGIADSINRSLQGLNQQYRTELGLLQNVLLCCDRSECPGAASCTLPILPDLAEVIDDKNKLPTLKWEERFSTASTASEIFLLEYATGMPCNKIGWGRVKIGLDCNLGSVDFSKIQPLHTLYFDKINRDPYVGTIQGSNLANQILLKLQEGVTGSSPPLVIYAGHDTNLASIAAMLGISWRLPDLPDNDTPPGGALVFELYCSSSDCPRGTPPESFFVKLHYVHATITQMRNKIVFSDSNPPHWAHIKLPGCPEPCDFKTFKGIVNSAINLNFTTTRPSGD